MCSSDLAANDVSRALDVARRMDGLSISFDWALQDLAALIHRIALAQSVPQIASDEESGKARVLSLANALAAEDLQLYYQIAIHGRQELPLAPDAYAGFTMALLRMFAFRPETAEAGSERPAGGGRWRKVTPGGGREPQQVRRLRLRPLLRRRRVAVLRTGPPGCSR